LQLGLSFLVPTHLHTAHRQPRAGRSFGTFTHGWSNQLPQDVLPCLLHARSFMCVYTATVACMGQLTQQLPALMVGVCSCKLVLVHAVLQVLSLLACELICKKAKCMCISRLALMLMHVFLIRTPTSAISMYVYTTTRARPNVIARLALCLCHSHHFSFRCWSRQRPGNWAVLGGIMPQVNVLQPYRAQHAYQIECSRTLHDLTKKACCDNRSKSMSSSVTCK
jgi:hypothetical protein